LIGRQQYKQVTTTDLPDQNPKKGIKPMSTILIEPGQLTDLIQTIFFIGGIIAGGIAGFALLRGMD
jgi:hypothetical protein